MRLTADLDPRYTLAATAAMKAWDKPVLILWGDSDRLFR
ncbi:alpha/beta hydrolase fold domain protein [Mycobacterium xenopi 4042]|uniref:Alpha/beta hydrolase fold domain protein n=1 Tax=Mycobacterium xenopi 4042 TaxID=1299334 RepID=X8DEL3_MYCXE|nr:alpha/beta hydrolase fold domain protein [Mycobacterium xenopi 4042]